MAGKILDKISVSSATPSPFSVPVSRSDCKIFIPSEAESGVYVREPNTQLQLPVKSKRLKTKKSLKLKFGTYKNLFSEICKEEKGVDSKNLFAEIQKKYPCYDHAANGGKGRALLELLDLKVTAKRIKGFKHAPPIKRTLYDFLDALNPRGKIYLSGSACQDIQKNDLVLKDLKDIDICLYYPPEEFADGESFEKVLGKYLIHIENPGSKVLPEVVFAAYAFKSVKFEGGISVRLNGTSLDISVKKEGGEKLSPYDSLWSSFRILLGKEYKITCPVPIQVLQHFRRKHINLFLTDIRNGLCRVNKCRKKQEDKGVPLFLLQPHLFEQLYERTDLTELAKYWRCDVTDKTAFKKYYDEHFTLLPKDELIKQWAELYSKESFSEVEQVTGLLLAELTAYYAAQGDVVCQAIVLKEQGKYFAAKKLLVTAWAKGDERAEGLLKIIEPSLENVEKAVEHLVEKMLVGKKTVTKPHGEDVLKIFLNFPPSDASMRVSVIGRWLKKYPTQPKVLKALPSLYTLTKIELEALQTRYLKALKHGEQPELCQAIVDLGQAYLGRWDLDALKKYVLLFCDKGYSFDEKLKEFLSKLKEDKKLDAFDAQWTRVCRGEEFDKKDLNNLEKLSLNVLGKYPYSINAFQALCLVYLQNEREEDLDNFEGRFNDVRREDFEPLILKSFGCYYQKKATKMLSYQNNGMKDTFIEEVKQINFEAAERYFDLAYSLSKGKMRVEAYLLECSIYLKKPEKIREYQQLLAAKTDRDSLENYALFICEINDGNKAKAREYFELAMEQSTSVHPGKGVTFKLYNQDVQAILNRKGMLEDMIEVTGKLAKKHACFDFLLLGIHLINKFVDDEKRIPQVYKKLAQSCDFFSSVKLKCSREDEKTSDHTMLVNIFSLFKKSQQKGGDTEYWHYYLPLFTQGFTAEYKSQHLIEDISTQLLKWCLPHLNKKPWINTALSVAFLAGNVLAKQEKETQSEFENRLRVRQETLGKVAQWLLEQCHFFVSSESQESLTHRKEIAHLTLDVLFLLQQIVAQNKKLKKEPVGVCRDSFLLFYQGDKAKNPYTLPLKYQRIHALLYLYLFPDAKNPTEKEIFQMEMITLHLQLLCNQVGGSSWESYSIHRVLQYWKFFHNDKRFKDFLVNHKITVKKLSKEKAKAIKTDFQLKIYKD